MAKNNKNESEIVEEIPIETKPVINPVSEKNTQISSKQFVKKLKEELKGKPIMENVYKSFIKNVPMVETDEYFRTTWQKTYNRQ